MGKVNKHDLSDLPAGLQWNDQRGWVIDKVVWGKRIKKKLGDIPRAKAELELLRLVKEVKEGTYISENKFRSLTVRDALNRWYVDHLQGMKSEERRHLLTQVDRLLGNKLVMALKKRDIDFYIKTRMSERKVIHCVLRNGNGKKILDRNGKSIPDIRYGNHISINTIKHELNELKMAVKNLLDNEDIPTNPLNQAWFKGKELQVPRPKKVILDFGQDLGPEFLMIYHHVTASWHWRLFYLTLYETGMRPNEVKLMRRSWIMEVVPGYYQICVPYTSEKTENQDRRIPISPRLAKRLMSHVLSLGENALVFESQVKPGEPIVDHDDQFLKAVCRAGLCNRKITVYSLRRTKATMWSAIDDLASRVALGHAPIDPHEESYVVVTPERLFRLIGVKIDTREKLRLFRKAV